jgi:GTP-binding protein YchF
MPLEAGIVGLPNVGKSTLFNALTAAGALAANYPFATIEPNVGVVAVPDPRLDTIASHIETQKVVPATLRLVDIAGIVAGASRGEGLGNKFLSHIREVDAICHVVRCFEKAPGGEDVTHVTGKVDPIADIETIETELILADLETIETALPKAERAARSKDHEAVARLHILKRLEPVLAEGRPARIVTEAGDIHDHDERRALKGLGMLSAKRVLYIANVDDSDPRGEGELAMRVRARATEEGMLCVPVCAKIEAELADLDPEDRDEMLADLGLEEPALHSVAREAFRLLGLQEFYTAGPKQVRAWPIPVGALAPQAAGTIHTDFERGFIRVEVYSVDELAEMKSEKAIKEAGKMRVEGKEYAMRDGDVAHFLFNV